jgi:phage replication O-like protein O
MASPQLENGNFQIANELAEAFCRVNLSAYESRILWVIIRKTYGWKKKSDRITYSQFEIMTGLNRWHIRRYLNRLIERNIITKTGSGQRLFYAFQKDYSLWKPLPKQATVATVAQIGYEPLPKQATKPLPKQATTKEKKETIKRKSDFSKSLVSLFSEIEIEFSTEDLLHKQEFLDYWTEKNPNGKKERWQMEKVFDVKRRYQTWLRNYKRWTGQLDADRKAEEIAEALKYWGQNNA